VSTLSILGASGHAREVEAIVRSIDHERNRWRKIQMVSMREEATLLADGGDAVLGMGSPSIRRNVMHKWWSTLTWPVLIHPHSFVGPRVELAAGVVLAVSVTVTVDVRIGEGSMLNTAVTVGHDVTIGACCLVNPNATISGDTILEDDVLIGAGAVVLEGRRVGRGASVGAGAVVTSDVEPGSVVVGVPARRLKKTRESH
jgi:sugar O-acyltransferase (sialic acid O-acetyltransferase NeuD family)